MQWKQLSQSSSEVVLSVFCHRSQSWRTRPRSLCCFQLSKKKVGTVAKLGKRIHLCSDILSCKRIHQSTHKRLKFPLRIIWLQTSWMCSKQTLSNLCTRTRQRYIIQERSKRSWTYTRNHTQKKKEKNKKGRKDGRLKHAQYKISIFFVASRNTFDLFCEFALW